MSMKYKTRGDNDPQGKPRVFFTCHPDDFEKCFDKICNDIFKFQDCAIYYTEDMNSSISGENRAIDIARNNLIVIPVTFKLLTSQNRTMDEDLVYALEEHIPVLPIMMESGIDEFYSLPNKFGELQYINPYSNDTTEIPYESKLEKYLESVLISNELANRVRMAFDAYIFLSYRKKDRNYANQLMRLIHNYPECRDIAIWYDEFLTPGESFKENISKILNDSKLFALLVTPNLLEESSGKPNYVMAEEYPAALRSRIDILPVEMEKTDKDVLGVKYKGIPACIDPYNTEDFKNRLMESIFCVVRTPNDDPTHNFLIGLAYLDGIDVEVDRQRAFLLISGAAENELPEAMEKLCEMYANGLGVKRNFEEVVKWIEKLVDYYTKHLGSDHPDTINALINLSSVYITIGNYTSALSVCTQVYKLCRKTYGEANVDTITSLLMLASIHSNLGDWKQALAYNHKSYELSSKLLGEDDQLTLTAVNNLGVGYGNLGEKKTALSYFEMLYSKSSRLFGIEDSETLTVMNNLAMIYNDLGNYVKAIELIQDCYKLRCKSLGDDHPDTIVALSNWAVCLGGAKQYVESLPIAHSVYEQCLLLYGEEHPDTLLAKYNLAMTYYYLKDYDKALLIMKPVYSARIALFGKRHKVVRQTRENLAVVYDKKSIESLKQIRLIEFIKFNFLAYKTLFGF